MSRRNIDGCSPKFVKNVTKIERIVSGSWRIWFDCGHYGVRHTRKDAKQYKIKKDFCDKCFMEDGKWKT